MLPHLTSLKTSWFQIIVLPASLCGSSVKLLTELMDNTNQQNPLLSCVGCLSFPSFILFFPYQLSRRMSGSGDLVFTELSLGEAPSHQCPQILGTSEAFLSVRGAYHKGGTF